jgi:TRAP-type mannitol/chloroaromatic compound transport system substrate-binding protein
VPAFEVLDAAHKKVIDGFHSIPYYWVNKNRAAVLFAGLRAGPFGMDHTDYLGWMWEGGGHDLWIELYQKELKLNLMPFSRTRPARRPSAGSSGRSRTWPTSRA